MARVIAIREEFLASCDEATLQVLVSALSRQFLLIPLDDYCIEVSEMDYAAVRSALAAFKRDYE
jgi:hypothetical protein